MLRLIAALLLLLAIIWLTLSLLAKIKRLLSNSISPTSTPQEKQQSQEKSQPNPRIHTAQDSQEASHDLVACAHCRIFLPIEEGIRYQGQYYCSKSCLPE